MTAATPVAAQGTDSLFLVHGGTYAGQAVRVDPGLASRRSSRFLRVSRLKGESRYVGWNPSHLPASVAFRPGSGITEADSATFWSILRQMEEDIGMRLFEPAMLSADADPAEVIIVGTKAMASEEGLTMVTWTANGALYDARVYVRSRVTLRSPRIVTHEMMHALGFGHTSAWTSVMNSGGSAPQRLTLHDVAYAQYAMESRAQSERTDMWERLALASLREPAADPRDPYEACVFSFDRISGSRERERGAPATVDQSRSTSCSR
jgi:hypothetical protein